MIQISARPLHALVHVGHLRFFFRSFSWKSRQNRDPDLRLRKKELLDKRYTFRRIGVLDESGLVNDVSEAERFIEKVLLEFANEISMLKNVSSVDRTSIETIMIGKVPLSSFALVSQQNPRTVVIVPKQVGNLDLVLKNVRRVLHPSWEAHMLDRDRIEVNLVPNRSAVQHISHLCNETLKKLKKYELETYAELRKKNTHRDVFEEIKVKFKQAGDQIVL